MSTKLMDFTAGSIASFHQKLMWTDLRLPGALAPPEVVVWSLRNLVWHALPSRNRTVLSGRYLSSGLFHSPAFFLLMPQ